MKRTSFLALAVLALIVASSWSQQPIATTEAGTHDYEVWVTVQGSHEILVFAPAGRPRGSDLELIDRIGYTDDEFINESPEEWGDLRNPHMILFGLHGLPGSRYGYVSNVSSHNTSIIDAEERKVVEVLDTGFRTHAVQASPDGTRALALAIGAGGIAREQCDGSVPDPECGQVAEIITDLEQGQFHVERTFGWHDMFDAEVPDADILNRFDPICGSFTPDSQFFYVTLSSGGLVIFEINDDLTEPLFDVVEIFPPGTGPGEIAANGCGVGYSTDGRLMFANSGVPSTGQSFYYVFDIATHSLIHSQDVTDIVKDVHGMMLSPSGHEVIMAGRGSDNFIVINQKTGALKPQKTFTSAFAGAPNGFAEAPDLTDFSPNGQYVYVTLRGPNPSTGTHDDNAGDTPGIAIVHYGPGRVVNIIALEGDQDVIDPHGLAIRRLGR